MRPLTATSLALALCLGGAGALAPVASQAQAGFGVNISVRLAPPPLPYYAQPPCPGYGYIWTPGYWAWNDYVGDYYWVPGTWVQPPQIGYLWTPGWWGWRDGLYVFNAGYWGPVVGFYGGVNYGYGYGGYGYEGGYWRGRDFFYNRTVNNITSIRVGNVYSQPVRTAGVGRVSFNGPGGAQARPTAAQLAAARGPRIAATSVQQQHFQMARAQPGLRAGVNHGAPPIAATSQPAVLRGPGVIPTAHRPAGYGGGPGAYRPPAAAYNNGYRASSRPTESFSAGGGFGRPAPASGDAYRPAPRPTEAFNAGGGFRAPSPQAARPEARSPPAGRPEFERRDNPRP